MPAHGVEMERLSSVLARELYGPDLAMVEDGRLVGCKAEPVAARPDRGLSGQRGLHYPEPPPDDPGKVVGAP